MSNRHPLDEIVALIPHNTSALKTLSVAIGSDYHDLVLYDSRVRTVGQMTPTGTSEADSFIGSRLSNTLWLGKHVDGSYVISDIDDFTLVDKPGYSIGAVLAGGIPLRDFDSATTDWTQVVTGQDTGIDPITQFPVTSAVATNSTMYPWVTPPMADCRAAFATFADAMAGYFPGRGILEVVVRPSSRYNQAVASQFFSVAAILPFRFARNDPQQGVVNFNSYYSFGWNVAVVSCKFYPFTETDHDHHRVDKIIRWRSEDGRFFVEQYRIFGPIDSATVTTANMWADATPVPVSVGNGRVASGVTFMGADVTPANVTYITSSVAATSLVWRATTPYRLLLSSTTVSGLVYVLDELPTRSTDPIAAPEVIPPANRYQATAKIGTLIDAKPNLLRRLRASVDGYEEPTRTQRLNAINDLDIASDATLRLHMYLFGDAGVPHYADCVEQTGLYRAGRSGPVLLDVLSVQVDADDTMRSLRNRARKAVQGVGVAYLMAGDGDDLLNVITSTNGFGNAVRNKLTANPQKYRVTVDSTAVIVSQRRFAVEEGRFPWTALTSEQLADLWSDVLEAAVKGTPVLVNSWLLLATLMGPGLSASDLLTLSGTLQGVGASSLIEERGHVAYMGRWPWDLRPHHVTAPVYFGIIAERATEVFSRFYLQHAAYVRGIGRISIAPSGKTADFLLDDNVDI